MLVLETNRVTYLIKPLTILKWCAGADFMPRCHGQAGTKGRTGSAQLDADSSQWVGKPHLASADIPRGPPSRAEGTALDGDAAGGALNMPV